MLKRLHRPKLWPTSRRRKGDTIGIVELGTIAGATIFHDVAGSLGVMLERALVNHPVIAALGPIYEIDPAHETLVPFLKTAATTGWTIADERGLAPRRVLEMARELRFSAAVNGIVGDISALVDWTRAGVVLELGSHWGITLCGVGNVHPKPRLKGSVTGRFGYEGVISPGRAKWNPMTIPSDDRWRVVPSGPGRRIVVIDFRAMDLCSMVCLVPELREQYKTDVTHERTARILISRDPEPNEISTIKRETFTYAYGGTTLLADAFYTRFPGLAALHQMPKGEAGRMVQERSAVTFRAALSRALPALISPECRPMFTVHDELVLDVTDRRSDLAERVCDLMEEGATEATGVVHTVRLSWGNDYESAKE